MKKKYSLEETSFIKTAAQVLEIPECVAAFLNNRGKKTEEQIFAYLNKEAKFTNPYEIPGMKQSVLRIKDAIDRGEKIIICGDYDVDGMLASSILFLFFKNINANIEIHIPDRVKDGYGLSVEQMDYLKNVKNADVLISVDNGISAFGPAAHAKKLGMDLIITDHHELPVEGLPQAYSIVNPKLITNDKYNLKDLCGAGVAFYLVRALNSYLFPEGKRLILTDYLVLAALATISDVVPLSDDNRVIVDKGLKFLFESDIVGLGFLLDEIKFYEYPNAQDISFYLTPILNATARMNQPYKTIELLTEKTLTASKVAKDLITINTERKEITKIQSEIAFKKAQELIEQSNPHILVIHHPEFHLGILGLLANRVTDAFRKTCFVIGENNGVLKGSGRTIGDIDLKKVIDAHLNLVDGGGHQMAVGFSMKKENLMIFTNQVQKFYESNSKNILNYREVEWVIDSKSDLSTLVKALYHMEPFGSGNPAPLVQVEGLQKFQKASKMKMKHIKIIISPSFEILAFNQSPEQMERYDAIISENLPFKAKGTLRSNGQKMTLIAEEIMAS